VDALAALPPAVCASCDATLATPCARPALGVSLGPAGEA